MRSKPVGILAAAVILVCAVILVRSQCSRDLPARPDDEGEVLMDLGALALFQCEACGKETTGSFRPTPFECPACGKKAVVESARYQCAACKAEFEAFRRRSVMSDDGKRPVAFEVKLPGSDAWERMKHPPVKCPKCGNEDPAKLLPAPPPIAPPKRPGGPPPERP